MNSGPDWITPLDHTGDAGFGLTAADLPQLFCRAARGMFGLICDLETVRPTETFELNLDAPDREALLVKWLSELNFRHITRHVLFGEFEVQLHSGRRLEAVARGEAIDPERHTIYTEIKAVTFHGLRIDREGDLWTAQVIFDL